MDIFHSSQSEQEDEKHPPQKFRPKKRLNQGQVGLLERSFTSHKKLDTELKQKLANQLGVPPRQVAIWYQNKRARWKTQSLELGYNTIQVRLQTALAEKRRLEKDVKQLREELREAQEMLFALNYKQKAVVVEKDINTVVSCNNYNSSASSCSDQKGFSSSFSLFHEDHNYVRGGGDHHDDDPALQIDHELYACLIDAGGSAWG